MYTEFISSEGLIRDAAKSVKKLDFEEFERLQLKYILSIGKDEGLLKISNIDSTANLILILLKSLDIPLFLQDKYEDYNQAIDELISLVSSGLKKSYN